MHIVFYNKMSWEKISCFKQAVTQNIKEKKIYSESKILTCMLSHFSCVQLFVILETVACQTPLSMKSSRQKHWSGLPCPPPGDLPDPGIKPASPKFWQVDSLPTEPPEMPKTLTMREKMSPFLSFTYSLGLGHEI